VEYNKLKESDMGVPQGGIVSPILSNLILHELDLFVEELIHQQEANNKGKRNTIKNPVYGKIDDSINYIARLGRKKAARGLELEHSLVQKRMALIKERAKIPSTSPNPKVARIYYVRYADD
jgi:retron-type reverse transcriptase